MSLLPNRVATYAGIATGIIGAVIPVAIGMDTTTIVGWVAGIGAIITAISVWMAGHIKYEARQAIQNVVAPLDGVDDLGDAGSAIEPAAVA